MSKRLLLSFWAIKGSCDKKYIATFRPKFWASNDENLLTAWYCEIGILYVASKHLKIM
jgi:hypothetical protein